MVSKVKSPLYSHIRTACGPGSASALPGSHFSHSRTYHAGRELPMAKCALGVNLTLRKSLKKDKTSNYNYRITSNFVNYFIYQNRKCGSCDLLYTVFFIQLFYFYYKLYLYFILYFYILDFTSTIFQKSFQSK